MLAIFQNLFRHLPIPKSCRPRIASLSSSSTSLPGTVGTKAPRFLDSDFHPQKKNVSSFGINPNQLDSLSLKVVPTGNCWSFQTVFARLTWELESQIGLVHHHCFREIKQRQNGSSHLDRSISSTSSLPKHTSSRLPPATHKAVLNVVIVSLGGGPRACQNYNIYL